MSEHVWVIEMLKDNDLWAPCSHCSIDKADAEFAMRDWRNRNPDDRFRVAKYVREDPSDSRR